MQALVSIITPCYNSEGYISRYLDSILSQSYKHIQQIIIDDGSTDGTADIINSYKDKLNDVGIELTYYYQENKGLGGAINTGLKLIRGKYFTWCDSDNFYSPDYVDENVNYFENHQDAAIVRCDGYTVLDSAINHPLSKLSDNMVNKNEKNLFINCLQAKDFYFGCTMLRTSSFVEVNPDRDIYPSREGQNWQIMLPMFYHFEAHYIDKPMFYFVIREDSISHKTLQEGLNSQIEQNNECERIEEITIKSMHIPEETECLEIIHKQYALIRFWLADQYQNRDMLESEYKLIKENGWSNAQIEKAIARWSNPLWRIGQEIKRSIK